LDRPQVALAPRRVTDLQKIRIDLAGAKGTRCLLGWQFGYLRIFPTESGLDVVPYGMCAAALPTNIGASTRQISDFGNPRIASRYNSDNLGIENEDRTQFTERSLRKRSRTIVRSISNIRLDDAKL
jgi:hypothetical protein